MSNRYNFCNNIEDETLSMFADLAKDMMKQIDSIVKIYKANDELLYGNSPKQVLFLMKQNNKPLCSSPPSPSSNKHSYVDISNPGPSTPILRNSNIQMFRRIQLLDSILDDEDRKENNSGTTETTYLAKHWTVNKDAAISSPIMDETAKINEQFSGPVGSTGSPSAGNEFSPCSAKTVTLVESLHMDKEVESPAKIASPNEAVKKDSPRTAELTRITSCLTVEEKDTSLVLTRADDERNAGILDSSRFVGVIRHTSDFQLNYKDSKGLSGEEKIYTNKDFGTKSRNSHGTDSIDKHSINQEHEIFKIPSPLKVGNNSSSPIKSVQKVHFEKDRTAVNVEYFKSGEKSGKSDNDDLSDKESVSLAEKISKTTNPIETKEATPSPIKISRLGRISDIGIYECSSQTEKFQMTDCSLEGTDISINPTQINKMNVDLNAECQTVVDERKRKPILKRRNAIVFGSMPKIIKSPSEAEMVIEIPSDSENNSSPTISPKVNSPLSKSPVMSESKTDDSPKTVKRVLSPSDRAISTNSPLNVSKASSLGSDDDCAFTDNSPSGISSMIETSIDHSKSESSVPNNVTEYFELKETVVKFHTLNSLRHQVLQKIYNSLLQFQNNLQFLNLFARNVGFIVNPISSLENFSSEELKEMAAEATGKVTKLMRKFTAWLKDMDLEVETWQKYFQQIENLKAQYGPFISSDGEPLMTIDILQVYEFELKSIWRKMDDMILLGDTRRSLFSQTNYDFEKLIKIFVKCLIRVGILEPR